MTHLAATFPQAPQAPHAMEQIALQTLYLQWPTFRLRKSVHRRLNKKFLENLNKVFHYYVIGEDAAAWSAVANLLASP